MARLLNGNVSYMELEVYFHFNLIFKSLEVNFQFMYNSLKQELYFQLGDLMILRDNYLQELIQFKDTDFITSYSIIKESY